MSTTTVQTSRDDKVPFLTLVGQHPIGFWFIFWGEFAERCSYYGMRAILATYIADKLGFGRELGGFYVSIFIAFCYLLPLLGGFLADQFIGKYNIIVAFSIPYILGHFILGIETPFFLFVALALLAIGSGVIKPNISTLMGLTYDQKRPGQELLRTQAFSIFYMAINIGAGISQISMPAIKNRYGYAWAFLFPAALMVVSFILFAIGKPFYAKETIVRRTPTPEERALRWQVLGEVGMLFVLVTFFWSVFDQSGSTWIYFAQTYMKNDFFSFDAESIQSLNAFLIVLLLPPVSFLFVYLQNHGMQVRATDKMIVGFALTAITMGMMSYCGFQTGQADMKRDKVDEQGQVVRTADGTVEQEDFIPDDRKVSLWWQAGAYLLLTIAEILISVTGLELAFVAAPQSMKSFVSSLWLFTVFLANFFLNAPLARIYPRMHPGHYFAMLSGIVVCVLIAFLFVAAKFNRTMAKNKAIEEGRSLDNADPQRIMGDVPPQGETAGI